MRAPPCLVDLSADDMYAIAPAMCGMELQTGDPMDGTETARLAGPVVWAEAAESARL